jgi:anti-sigma-K factor RskA
MSGRVLRFGGSAHTEAQRLLPWFVNGTLKDEELALIERHLGECADCRREADGLRQLQAAFTDTAPSADATQSFLRLRRRIETSRVQPLPRLTSIRRTWSSTSPWMRWAVAVQFAAILILGGLQFVDDRPAATYRTLGDPDVSSQGATSASPDKLVVVFDPQISEAQMRRLLRASGARIVDGPTDTGAYVLVVPARRAATVREALQAAPGVTLVERLAPDDGR